MSIAALQAISPIDGRYASKTQELRSFFSEEALIRYRVHVEIMYFIALCKLPLPQLKEVTKKQIEALKDLIRHFSTDEALAIKAIEKTTNHDVKAVEYYIKEEFDRLGLAKFKEFIHFGLTSQDINNTAIPMSIKDALERTYRPEFQKIITILKTLSSEWDQVPMLARTHGQPASPTRLGKEIQVFITRLEAQFKGLDNIPFAAKFGGATGNFNAHHVAYPEIQWKDFGRQFVEKNLGLHWSFPTTQIEHYDHLASLFDALKRINTILLDLNRDLWTYISMDYFKQKIKDGEVGSSAMPHKVNPIDFENSEGNIGIANALFEHLSSKLPVSRLQRDLTDSTVLRCVGVPIGHTLIAMASTRKGLSKLVLNQQKIDTDLDANWAVLAEAIQTILRRDGYPNPYEALKDLTRTHDRIHQKNLHEFIAKLDVSKAVKEELLAINPKNYTGI